MKQKKEDNNMFDSSFHLHLQQQQVYKMQTKIPIHATVKELLSSILSLIISGMSIDWIIRSIIG